MKIVSSFLTEIEGIQVYYIIGLLIFVIFFITILIRTQRTPKTEFVRIKNSIFDNDELNNIKSDNKNN